MDKNIKPDELMELYQTARQIIWRYNIDKMEISALKTAMKSIEKAAYDILSNPSKRMQRWEQLRRQDLIQELESLTAGIIEQVTGEISSLASQAGAESTIYHSQTMSVGGKLPGFNNVALSPEQFKAFFETTPMGGYVLSDWVNRAFDATVQQGLLEDLGAGMLQGKGYPGLVDSIMGHMKDFTRKEAVTLARTFVQTANVSAMSAVMAANSDIVKGWRWSSVLENSNMRTGTGTCIRCAALDNSTYELGEGPPIPLHPNCITGDMRVSSPGTVAVIKAKYSGPIFDVCIDGGNTISLTPNHRVMTSRGVVEAKSLNTGDKVVFDLDHFRLSQSEENNYGLPSRIRDIFDFFSNIFFVTGQPASSSEYLHGDSFFVDGNINIVFPKSLLRGDIETLINQDIPNLFLPSSNVCDVDLSGLSKRTSTLIAMGLAFQCITDKQSMFDALSFGHSVKPDSGRFNIIPNMFSPESKSISNNAFRDSKVVSDLIGRHPGFVHIYNVLLGQGDGMGMTFASLLDLVSSFGFIPEVDTLSNQGRFDALPANIQKFTDFLLGFSPSVQLRNVDFIRQRSFNGHVYDLQSFSTTYHVEGVLSSNCRCVQIPQTVTFRELGIDIDEFEEVARPWTTRPDIPIGDGGRNILTWGSHKGEYASWFESRGEQFQKNVVGPKRLALIQSGKVSFKDLVDPETGRLYRLDEL